MTVQEIIAVLYRMCKERGIPVHNCSVVRLATGEVLPQRSIIVAGTARFFLFWGSCPNERRIAALNQDGVDLARILLKSKVDLVQNASGVCTKAEFLAATGSVAQYVKAAQPKPVAEVAK